MRSAARAAASGVAASPAGGATAVAGRAGKAVSGGAMWAHRRRMLARVPAAMGIQRSEGAVAAGEGKGLAVGAVLVEAGRAQVARAALLELGWQRKGASNVTTPRPAQLAAAGLPEGGAQLLALHLSQAGALGVAELIAAEPPVTDKSEQAARLRRLLAEGEAHFVVGMRAGMARNGRLPGWEEHAGGPPPRFKFVELFAGIGGFRVGLDALGGRSVFASEIDPEAQVVYCNNFEAGLLVGDITQVEACEVPPHDLLTAGFCCQSFSKAGEQLGLDDPRGQLFYEIVRILRAAQPASFLLENVANLLLHDSGASVAEILAELQDAGYEVTFRVVNSSTLLPQHRQRLYFAGFRRDLRAEYAAFRWPELPLLGRTVGDILEAVDAPGMEAHRLTDSQWEKVASSSAFQEDPGRRAAMRHGPARTLMSSYRTSFQMHSEFVFPAEQEVAHQSDRPPRFYTPRESARLQGFPEDFCLDVPNPTRIYHSLGNAVSPPVVAAIGASILRALEHPADGAGDRQELLGAALRLVEAASPLTTAARAALDGVPLPLDIERYLAEPGPDGGDFPVHVGYTGDVQQCGGPAPVAALLACGDPRAQMTALRDISYLTHSPPVTAAAAASNRECLAAWPGLTERIRQLAAAAAVGDERAQAAGQDPASVRSVETIGGSVPTEAAAAAEPLTGSARKPGARDRSVAAEVQRLALLCLHNFGLTAG